MMPEDLKSLVATVCKTKTETQELEIKSARGGCPKRLFDTLSSFSNQDSGGIILFGVDEESDFQAVGVYDAHDLQKQVTEQCNQMTPVVRPLFTVVEEDGKLFVSAEIPAVDVTERPCFYAGSGRLKGSYIRIGDADQRMTEYEIYSYEAYRKRYQDDIRPVPQASVQAFDDAALEAYIQRLKKSKPNLARLEDRQIHELMGITKDGVPTLAAVFLFGLYPQAYFPQLCILAVVVPGTVIAENGPDATRFLDNKRIEGTIPQMFDQALAFVIKNMRVQTVIDPVTGKRNDRYEYPVSAVREALLNALVHRDYSMYTEGKPIQVSLFSDRLEICNPGGLYGRIRVDQLGRVQPDTRNPVLATALEMLEVTENRYSGIPTIRAAMKQQGLPEPVFEDTGNAFLVTLRNDRRTEPQFSKQTRAILDYCATARTRKELAGFLGMKSVSYAIATYITPLVEQGLLELTLPMTPQSPKQRYKRAAGLPPAKDEQ